MKIESSQILMQMEHQAEQQSSAISLVLPNGPGNSFAELFAYLRTRSGSGSPADQPQDTESPGDAPGLLMANIAGARQLQVNATPSRAACCGWWKNCWPPWKPCCSRWADINQQARSPWRNSSAPPAPRPPERRGKTGVANPPGPGSPCPSNRKAKASALPARAA